MRKIKIFALLTAIGIFPVAHACEISPTLVRMQFCVDTYALGPTDTATVDIPGIPSTDFTAKPVLGTIKIVYRGKITEAKKGKIIIRAKSGDILAEHPISIVTKDYAAGYDRVVKGTFTLLKEMRN
jgi:hypothetical protein